MTGIQALFLVQFYEVFAPGQVVFRRRLASARENASFISPFNEGFSLPVGADFSGKPSTLRL